MKNKLFVMLMTVILGLAVVGCGDDVSDDSSIKNIEIMETEIAQADSVLGEETPVENQMEISEQSENTNPETESLEAVDLTFADLAARRFGFSSGAGGWSEEFTIEKDGSFTGLYNDSDMGDTGEGYADGTRYSSSYSGHFTDLTKVNDHTYQMKLADISYREEDGAVEIEDNIRYIYTQSYCLGGNDTFKVYLPGTPLSELSEEVRFWLSSMNQSETELTMIAIVDESNAYGIYSHERPTPLEEAQMTYNTYKESYDYYAGLLLEASTTMEMVEYTGSMYELSDSCLNQIWNIIRYNVEEDRFEEILAEQRAWITEKEARAQEISTGFEGGSFAAVDYNDTLAMLTIERCEELIEYLK